MSQSLNVPITGEDSSYNQPASAPADCRSKDKPWHDASWEGPGLKSTPRSQHPGVAPVEPDAEPKAPWRTNDSDRDVAKRVYTMISSLAGRAISTLASRWMSCRETVYIQPTPPKAAIEEAEISVQTEWCQRLRHCITTQLMIFNVSALMQYSSCGYSVVRDLFIVLLMTSQGMFTARDHLTAEEWASLCSTPAGAASSRSTLMPDAMHKIRYAYFLTDSGMLMYRQKGPACSLQPFLKDYGDGWDNVTVHSGAGA